MDKDISEAAAKLSARRKVKRGGFNDPKVQAKIKEIKQKNRDRIPVPNVPPADKAG